MINFYFILLKKSRLFRYLMKRYPSLAAFTGLGLTQLRVLPNESSVLSPAIQSGLGKLSAHTFLTDTILAPGSQPDSKSVTVGHPSREHREPREEQSDTEPSHSSHCQHNAEKRFERREESHSVGIIITPPTVERHHCLSPTLIPV